MKYGIPLNLVKVLSIGLLDMLQFIPIMGSLHLYDIFIAYILYNIYDIFIYMIICSIEP